MRSYQILRQTNLEMDQEAGLSWGFTNVDASNTLMGPYFIPRSVIIPCDKMVYGRVMIINRHEYILM